MKNDRILVRVEKKQKKQLEKLANENKREFSDYIRLVCQYAIDKKLKF